MELKEIWKYIPNSKDMYVSNLGRIKLNKGSKVIIKDSSTIGRDKDGYPRITYITLNGDFKGIAVHRLVALLFLPIIENKNIVNHIDCDRTNNKVTNLEWVTTKENVYHSYQHGNRKKCLEVPKNSKLTAFQISQISFLRQYYSLKKISELYNISYTSMKNIVIKLKRLSQDNQQPSIYDNNYHNEGSTTIPYGSTSQANGDGNALH